MRKFLISFTIEDLFVALFVLHCECSFSIERDCEDKNLAILIQF